MAIRPAAPKVASNPIYNVVNTVPKKKAVVVPKVSSNPIFNTVPTSTGTVRVPEMPTIPTVSSNPIYSSTPTARGTIPPSSRLAVQEWSPEEYQRQIELDPAYQSALTGNQAAKQQARNTLTSLIQKSIISSGFDPTGQLSGDLSGYAGDVNPETLAAANQNPFSTRAQLDKAYNESQADLPYQLAARGALRSGAAATSGSRLTSSYQLQGHNALAGLLDTIRGNVTDYLNAGLTADQALQQSRADVAARLAQLPGRAPTEAQLGGFTGEDTGGGDQGGGGYEAPAAPAAPPPTKPPVQPTQGVSWGGQTFTTKAALARWLAARGASYGTWAANHPDAAGRLK